jgi:hypothetical protein
MEPPVLIVRVVITDALIAGEFVNTRRAGLDSSRTDASNVRSDSGNFVIVFATALLDLSFRF